MASWWPRSGRLRETVKVGSQALEQAFKEKMGSLRRVCYHMTHGLRPEALTRPEDRDNEVLQDAWRAAVSLYSP